MEYEEVSPVRKTTLDDLKELVLSMKTTNEKDLSNLNEQMNFLREENYNSIRELKGMIEATDDQLNSVSTSFDFLITNIQRNYVDMTNDINSLRGETNALRMDMGDMDRNVDEIRSSTGSEKNKDPKKNEKSNRKKVKIDEEKTRTESSNTRSIFSRRTTIDQNKNEDEELEDSEDDEIDKNGVKYRRVKSNISPPKIMDPKQKSSTQSGSTPMKNTTPHKKSSGTSGSSGDPGDSSDSSDTSESGDDNKELINPRDLNRRLTINPRVPVDLVNSGTEGSVAVMVHPYRVDEKDKIRTITLRSMKRLAETYKEYLATSLDKTKTLIYFIHPDAQKELFTKQGLLQTKIAENYTLQELYSMKDKHTEKMMADYIRPLGRDEFVEALHKAMTFPKWKAGIKFGVVDYYRHIFEHVTLFLEEAWIYHSLLVKKAKAKHLAKYPKHEWGRPKPGGLFRVLMQVLEPYTENFVEMLGGEDKLRKILTLEDFLAYFKKLNMEKAKKSREQEEEDSELKAPMSYVTSTASARKKHEDFSTFASKPRSSYTPRVPFVKKSTRGNLRILYDEEGHPVPVDENWLTNPEDETEENEDYEDNPIYHGSMTEEEMEIAFEEEQNRRAENNRKIENWDETLADHEETKYAANALYAFLPGGQKPGSSSSPYNRDSSRNTITQKPGEQVCFALAYGKCPLGDKCQYSHDKMKIEDFLWKQFNKMKNSPHWKDAILQRPPPKPQEPRSGYENHKPSFSGGNGKPYAGRGGIHTPMRKVSYGENKQLDAEEVKTAEGQVILNILDKPVTVLPLSTEKSGSTRTPSSGGGDRANSDV